MSNDGMSYRDLETEDYVNSVKDLFAGEEDSPSPDEFALSILEFLTDCRGRL